MECAVCLDTCYDVILCGCTSNICIDCAKEYILTITTVPHCPNCKSAWTRMFLLDRLGKKYMDTTYKEHWKRCLLDRELAKLQEYLNNKYIANTRQTEIRRAVIDWQKVNGELMKLKYRKIKTEAHMNRIAELEPIAEVLKAKYVECIKKHDAKKGVNMIVCACPVCPSFVMKPEYKCSTCYIKICKQCREILNDDHKCNPDTVESVKLLKKDTKPCPKCAAQIHKLDGCDQMWCVSCHTTFSWKTGTIDTTRVHNPHYFDWLRRTGQNIQPVPNQGCLNNVNHILQRAHHQIYLHEIVKYNAYIQIQQTYHNIRERIETYQRYLGNTQNVNDLLESHIHKRQTKPKMASTLLRRDNMREKYTEIIQLLEMVMTVYKEVLGTLDFTTDFYKPYKKHMTPIVLYANEHFVKLSVVYKWSFPYINHEFYISPLTYTTKDLIKYTTEVAELLK
jgi:hypothetical protein